MSRRDPEHAKDFRRREALDWVRPRSASAHEGEFLEARVAYAQETVADFVRSRARGGVIIWEGDKVARVLLPDVHPEPLTVRELVERKLI